MPDRKESAADITVSVHTGLQGEEQPEVEGEVVVEQMTLTKEIDINEIYGSSRLFPDGYSIDQVSYQGDIELQGNRLELERALFDDDGVPREFSITITHFDGTNTVFSGCLATSDGWEMSAGETTTTTYQIIAMRRQRRPDGPEDQN